MKKLNRKGFTLVELLAVIVVLAIIMIIAIPNVLDAMNSGRQSSFLIYAEKMITSAQSKYQSDSLIQTMPQNLCYNIDELQDSAAEQYRGFVMIEGAASSTPKYTVQMFDNTYSVGIITNAAIGDKTGGVTYSEIEKIKSSLDKGDLNFADDITSLDSPCTKEERNWTTRGEVIVRKQGATTSSTSN